MKCAFCKFAAPYIDRDAEFVIDGQAVCEDHVDTATNDFGAALYQLQRDQDREANL